MVPDSEHVGGLSDCQTLRPTVRQSDSKAEGTVRQFRQQSVKSDSGVRALEYGIALECGTVGEHSDSCSSDIVAGTRKATMSQVAVVQLGAEHSNANISFPEHFEGKRQGGEMYQKDCLPLLSTFCKFQRLKVKGS